MGEGGLLWIFCRVYLDNSMDILMIYISCYHYKHFCYDISKKFKSHSDQFVKPHIYYKKSTCMNDTTEHIVSCWPTTFL